MTQVKMPDPVAKIGNTFQLLWFGARTITEIAEQTGAKVGSQLITTTQAEAYKDACVREALEQAAKQCEGRYQPWGNLADDRAADCMSRAAGRIRALLPSTPA